MIVYHVTEQNASLYFTYFLIQEVFNNNAFCFLFCHPQSSELDQLIIIDSSDRSFVNNRCIKMLRINFRNGTHLGIFHNNGVTLYMRAAFRCTDCLWMEDLRALHIEGRSEGESWQPMSEYWEEFEHPLWKKTKATEYTGGHGGMDWLVMRAFLDAVRNKTQTPIDVYDSATLMAVGILSEESIAEGSAPKSIPDFTDGMWLKRDPAPKTIFSLAEVDDSLYEGDVTF